MNLYCEHGIYSYAASPVFGTCQEGDGLAKGVATVATLSIDLSGYTAAAGNSFVIGGATLTCVTSGAGANQFNAGSGATLATNLAAAINAATNAITAPAAGWTTPQLRNACFAQASGTTLNIQTRAGSSVYNNNASFKAVSTGLTGGSQFNSFFTGGASGAWGWFVNDDVAGVLWPSAMAKWTYGFCYSTRIAGASPTGADIVYIRANNASVNHTAASTNANVNFGYETNIVVDDGTIWTGDTGDFRIVENITGSSAFGMFLQVGASNIRVTLTALTKSKFQINSNGIGFILFNTSYNSFTSNGLCLENATINDNAGGGISLAWSQYSYCESTFFNCDFNFNRNAFKSFATIQSTGYASYKLTIENCNFNWTTYTGAPGAIISFTGTNQNAALVILIKNCTATGITPYAFGAYSVIAGSYGSQFIAENLNNFSVSTSMGLLGYVLSAFNSGGDETVGYCLQQNVGQTRQFRLDTQRTTVAWNTGLGYPYLDSFLPDGTGWSYSVLWGGSNVQYIQRPCSYGLTLLKLSKTISSTAGLAGTVALEMLFDSAISANIKSNMLSMTVTYIADSDGKTYIESTRLPNYRMITEAGDSLAAGSGGWTKNSYSGYDALKIAKTLSRAIRQGTELEIELKMHKANPSAANTTFFVNPNISVS